jgi:phage virion morphogenesis protein
MAGSESSIAIDYDDNEIRQALERLESISGQLQPAMLEISEYLHERTRENFDNAQSPDDIPWAAMNEATLERKQKKGVPINLPLHGESLHLRDTIFPFASNYEAGISTGPATQAYAATHQFGDDGRNITARPYLGMSDADEIEILDIINDHIGSIF